MQAEITSTGPTVPVTILGVNEFGHESGNDLMTDGRVLAWLQDTQAVDVWTTWDVSFRDVVIIDENNERTYSVNLTTYDLHDPANYDMLKGLLLSSTSP